VWAFGPPFAERMLQCEPSLQVNGLTMPVTARLSKLFYDRLGEAVTNELVDWFNQVDATYNSDLREMNEVNFARFDAKLEQRLAELRAEMHIGFATLDAKIEKVEARSNARLEAALREQTRFFFLAWAAQVAAILGLWFR
jgi:hypothetical protein